MEKNGESINSMSAVKSKSAPASGDFHCSSKDLKKAFMPEKHESNDNQEHHEKLEKYSCGSNIDDNNISNNNNDDDNRDDIGCVHYKRRAKFVVSNSPKLSRHLYTVYTIPISHSTQSF